MVTSYHPKLRDVTLYGDTVGKKSGGPTAGRQVLRLAAAAGGREGRPWRNTPSPATPPPPPGPKQEHTAVEPIIEWVCVVNRWLVVVEEACLKGRGQRTINQWASADLRCRWLGQSAPSSAHTQFDGIYKWRSYMLNVELYTPLLQCSWRLGEDQ